MTSENFLLPCVALPPTSSFVTAPPHSLTPTPTWLFLFRLIGFAYYLTSKTSSFGVIMLNMVVCDHFPFPHLQLPPCCFALRSVPPSHVCCSILRTFEKKINSGSTFWGRWFFNVSGGWAGGALQSKSQPQRVLFVGVAPRSVLFSLLLFHLLCM